MSTDVIRGLFEKSSYYTDGDREQHLQYFSLIHKQWVDVRQMESLGQNRYTIWFNITDEHGEWKATVTINPDPTHPYQFRWI